MLITSTKNEIVKSVRRLRDRSARRESGQHLIEGERLVFDALEAGIVPETLLLSRDARILKHGFRHSVRSFFP